MINPTTHRHPNPALNRLIHFGAIGIVGVMLLAAALQVLLILIGAPVTFLLTAALTLLLALPVLMLTAVAPGVTVDTDGLILHPVIWAERRVGWHEIAAVRPYPLLPPAEAETNRRAMVGRRNYRPAEGIMLVIPSLPAQYRIGGLLAGERARPIIALTNRAHTDYERLVREITDRMAQTKASTFA